MIREPWIGQSNSSSWSLLEDIMQNAPLCIRLLALVLLKGGQISHHPLGEEGGAGRGRGEPLREDALH